MKSNITLYHNSRCSKSRAVLEILEQAEVPFTIVECLVQPPTAKILDQLLTALNLEPEAIVRKSEDEYEALKLNSNPPKNRDAWIEVLIQNPILMERPIVTNGTTAVVGRPPENVSAWLKSLENN